jgi:CheY-like chemotaxis protein
MILLAEDDPVSRELAIGILEKREHSVVVVSNGREALAALRKQNFDLILMDVQMPEMDGIEATQVIRSSEPSFFNPDIPIIGMTAHALKGDRERCLEAGMSGYVSKPVVMRELLEVIERFTPNKVKKKIERVESIQKGDVLDKVEALARLDGDEHLLRKIWTAFIENTPNQMETLRKALEAEDTALIERQAHSLKAAAANIGASLMKDEAFRMELDLRKGDLSQVHTLYGRLEYEFQRVLTALADLGCQS